MEESTNQGQGTYARTDARGFLFFLIKYTSPETWKQPLPGTEVLTGPSCLERRPELLLSPARVHQAGRSSCAGRGHPEGIPQSGGRGEAGTPGPPPSADERSIYPS